MCGLVGVFGTINHKEKVAFKWLLNFDTTRGEHSTGVLSVSPTNETHVYKELGTPYKLFDKFPEQFPKGVYEGKTQLLMGHNRFATQGAIVAENAHPFEFENVIGAHNGTVAAWACNSLHNNNLYEIDSQKLYAQLNHNADVQELWKHLEDSHTTAASLTFWDKRDSSLNFVRNSQRPMVVVLSKDGNTLFYASEEWMLTIACGVSGVSIQKPETLDKNHHYKLSIKEGKMVLNKKAVEPKKWLAVSSSTYNVGFANTAKSTKMVDLRIDHIVEDANAPYVAITKLDGATEESGACVPPVIDRAELFALTKEFFKLHKEIYEGDVTLSVDESYFFQGYNQTDLRYGAFRLIKSLKEEIEELKAEKSNWEKPGKDFPPFAIAKDILGNSVQGRALKHALDAAGNNCSCCGITNIKKGDLLYAHGGVFLSTKEFICGDCVSEGFLEYYTT